MSDHLAAKVVEFCSRLRREHDFDVGPREAQEAIRAIETVGVNERARVGAALRTVCCSRREEIELFDRAFAAFFSTEPLGVAQPRHAEKRRTRPDRTNRPEAAPGTQAAQPPHRAPQDEGGAGALRTSAQPEAEGLAAAWQVRRARYSPTAGPPGATTIPTDGLYAALAEAQRLITKLSLGRSLRWKPKPRGERFDLRRTLRASMRTGGDVMTARMLGHPLRNPRFVLLLDGSRSMSEHGARMLQFAYALCRRTRRASVFLFSTKLREITRNLREAGRGAPYVLDDLGEAWGGGTRIGASLTECVRKHGARFDDATFVIVISDGLDVGDVSQLKRAMHEIARRSAAIGWINPHVGRPGYAPSASGMQAVLPYLSTFTSFDEMRALTNLGRRKRVTTTHA
jgi:uncharacterized protein